MNNIGRRVIPFDGSWCIKKDGPIGDNGKECFICSPNGSETNSVFYAVSEPYQEKVTDKKCVYKGKFLFIDVKSEATGNIYRTLFSESMFVDEDYKPGINDSDWYKLKEKLYNQLDDIKRHTGCSGTWSTCGKMYREVLKLMTAIENGVEGELKPFNCCFRTEEEIDEILCSE